MKMLEKLQKRLQQGKKDNKGFSLVELIIVIAIMAILIGIVGMNVIPQIENARRATDAEVLSALVTEAMEAWTMAEAAAGTFTITISMDSDGKLTGASCTSSSALESKFKELAKIDTRVMKSSAGKELKITAADGSSSSSGFAIICDKDNGVYIGTIDATEGYKPPAKFDGYEFRSR